MVEETLVENLITDSIKLVKELDSQGDSPTKVVWYYFSDADEWRLLVASAAFDLLLPRNEHQAYQKIGKAVAKAELQSLTIADVKLVRTDYALFAATKFLVKTAPDALARVHVRDCTFNGIFVKQMLVLRASGN